MKKFLSKIGLVLVAVLMLSWGTVANATLYSTVTQDLGLTWSSVETRAELAAEYGVFQYTGTSEQNILLESRIRETHGFDLPAGQFGFSVATGYKSTVRTSMSATQSTISVSSLTLRDGQTLNMSALGSVLFLSLEPGKDKEEIAMCTGITTSTLTFTGCTRGLAFSGTDTSSVVANRQTHNAGSTVVLSNSHYVFEQLADLDTSQTINAPYTFTSSSPNIYYTFPVVSSTGYTGLPTNNGDLASKYYVDTVGAGGFTSLNASTTKGLEVYGTSPETVGINASSTTGMGFDANGALYQAIGNALEYTNNAIGVSTSTIVEQIATSTPTADAIVMASSTGLVDGGWIPNASLFGATATTSLGNVIITSGTTTLTEDAYYNNLTIQTGAVLDPDGYRVFVKNTLTFEGTGKIANNGGNGGAAGIGVASAAGSAGTLANATGTLPASLPGKAGGVGDETNCTNGAQGGAGVASTKSLGVAGSAGGAGGPATAGQTCSTSQRAGGSEGTLSSTIVDYPYNPFKAFFLFDLFPTYASFNGSASSGGGSGGVGGAVAGQLGGGGGGSGASGGSVWVAAQRIVTVDGNNYIEAKGGNGGAGASSGGSVSGAGGGGAGGPGGWVILIYHTKTGTGTISVAGGTAGANGAIGNQGTSAVAGLTGKTYVMQTQ